MFYIFLDTCVFLDISTKKQELPLVSALEELVRTKIAKLVVIEPSRDCRRPKTLRQYPYEKQTIPNRS